MPPKFNYVRCLSQHSTKEKHLTVKITGFSGKKACVKGLKQNFLEAGNLESECVFFLVIPRAPQFLEHEVWEQGRGRTLDNAWDFFVVG